MVQVIARLKHMVQFRSDPLTIEEAHWKEEEAYRRKKKRNGRMLVHACERRTKHVSLCRKLSVLRQGHDRPMLLLRKGKLRSIVKTWKLSIR